MTNTREEQIARIEVALEQLLGTQPWTPSLLSRSDRRLIATAITNAMRKNQTTHKALDRRM